MVEHSDALKRESIRQWSSEPAGAHLAKAKEAGTREFYNEVARTRYSVYPWLREYVEDPWWTGKRILEVGVGLGTDHMELRRTGAMVTGVDLTPTSIWNTGRRFELEGEHTSLVEADCESLPFEDDAFDGVYSFGVLHHTPDMQRAIDEVHRVVRPGGRAVIGLYNRHSYFHAWRLSRYYLGGEWRHKSRAQMRADFEFGEGAPVVLLSSKRELGRAFGAFAHVELTARHLPVNRLPESARAPVQGLTRPVEKRFGWYWMVRAVA